VLASATKEWRDEAREMEEMGRAAKGKKRKEEIHGMMDSIRRETRKAERGARRDERIKMRMEIGRNIGGKEEDEERGWMDRSGGQFALVEQGNVMGIGVAK
jgi:hypothetical protein